NPTRVGQRFRIDAGRRSDPLYMLPEAVLGSQKQAGRACAIPRRDGIALIPFRVLLRLTATFASSQNAKRGKPVRGWVHAAATSELITIDEHLRCLFSSAVFRPFGGSNRFDVLVASCGTGPHLFEVANTYKTRRSLPLTSSVTKQKSNMLRRIFL